MEGCERASRAQERFVPFERLTAPTDGNKFGTISGLKCGRTSLDFAFNLEPAADAFFGQYGNIYYLRAVEDVKSRFLSQFDSNT